MRRAVCNPVALNRTNEAAPELRQKMGMEPAYLGSAQTAAFIASEIAKWAPVIRATGTTM